MPEDVIYQFLTGSATGLGIFLIVYSAAGLVILSNPPKKIANLLEGNPPSLRRLISIVAILTLAVAFVVIH